MEENRPATALQDDIAGQILELAQQERWPEGHHIVEKVLAKGFGVSRTPVRRALQFLEAKGLVELVPNKGFVTAADLTAPEFRQQFGRGRHDELDQRLIQDRANGVIPAEISEAELTELYGVSRGKIRRALIGLSSEGIVRRQRGHGWAFVASLDSAESVIESYRFRVTVECSGLHEPTFEADPEALRELAAAHRRLIAQDFSELDLGEWFLLNTRLHETLASWSGNRFILQSVRMQNNLRRLKEYSVFRELPEERIKESLQEHLAILEAISTRDIELAILLLKRHLETSLSFAQERVETST